jgi:hypothetical protein
MDAATATSFRGREYLGMCALAGKNGQSGCGEGAKLDGRSYFTRMRDTTVGTAHIEPPLPTIESPVLCRAFLCLP